MTAVRALVPLLLALAACRAPAAARAGLELVVLGTAQDGGMPHVGCTRDCCVEARVAGRERYPACLGVRDLGSGALCLIEATPRVEPQLALLHDFAGDRDRAPRSNPVDAVLLTHAHIGHYLGLAQFGKEVASTSALPVHLSPRFAGFLRDNAPWSQLVDLGQIELREVAAGEAFDPLPGLTVRALAVPHRDEFSDTFAYRLEGPRRTVLFVPDVDGWSDQPGLLDELLEGVDVAYLDATFYDGSELPGRDLSQIRHPFVTDTMERLADAAANAPAASASSTSTTPTRCGATPGCAPTSIAAASASLSVASGWSCSSRRRYSVWLKRGPSARFFVR